jgi:hypothetical protein
VRNAFWCDPRFSKISKRGLAISHEIGYTVCRAKRKATVSRLLQQAIWKRSFFMCGLFFRGPQPSAVQSSGIPPFFDSSSSDSLYVSPPFKWFPSDMVMSDFSKNRLIAGQGHFKKRDSLR